MVAMITGIWQAIEGFDNAVDRSRLLAKREFQNFRRPVTTPLCKLLIRLHINQSHITITRFVLLIIFFPLWIGQHYYIAVLLLAINFFLDMIDGDLARILKTNSDLGKFEDVMADNFMVVVFPLALIWQGLVSGFLGAYFIFVVSLSWWLSVIRRNYGVKSDWLFKPEASSLLHIVRFWVLTVLVVLYALFRVDVVSEVMLALSIILTLIAVYDYYHIMKSRFHS
jgi:phosphatidylglycerophosphate synthase